MSENNENNERPQLNPYPGSGAASPAQRHEDLPIKRSQGKVIIILLICILAVNVAALAISIFPRAVTTRGNFPSGAPVTSGQFPENVQGTSE